MEKWRVRCLFFFSSRRRHTRCSRDWSSDVCSSDLLLTGRIMEAEDARAIGLVNEIVAAEKLLTRSREPGDLLIAASPASLSRAKRLMTSAAAPAVDHDLERAILENARIRCTPDFNAALASFLEKRKPVWQGKPD